jgi:hypothetical protein
MPSLLAMPSLLTRPQRPRARTTHHVVLIRRACLAQPRANQSHLHQVHQRAHPASRSRRRLAAVVVDQLPQAALVAAVLASPALVAELAHLVPVAAALLQVAVHLVRVAVAPVVQEVVLTIDAHLVVAAVVVVVRSKSCAQSTFRPTPPRGRRFRLARSSSNVMAAPKT